MDEANVQTQNILTVSDTNSEESTKTGTGPLPLDKRICLVGSVIKDAVTCRAAHDFGVPVITSDTGIEYITDTSCTTIFILDDFDHANFKQLQSPPHRILGSIALQQLADRREKLPNNSRPLYSTAMWGVVVCFTGFRKKEDLTRLIPLIHHMGGSIRKDMVIKVTHLIANSCGGNKYQYAITFKVPVMDQRWVMDCWDRRKEQCLNAINENIITMYKLKPFYGAKVCFVGFSNDETKHMNEVLEANGGQVIKLDDPSCTHVVLENWETYNVLSPQNSSTPQKLTSFAYDIYPIQPPVETDQKPQTEQTITEHDSQKRKRRSLEKLEFNSSFKRKRNSSFIGFETPGKKRFKDIFKTPIDLLSRRNSITSTSGIDKVLLNDSVSEEQSELFNDSDDGMHECSEKSDQFKYPAVNLFSTPKSKSLFKRGFRKSFISDKTPLKNIMENDLNRTIDYLDVSTCERTVQMADGCCNDPDPSLHTHASCGAEGPVRPFCKLSASCTPVVDESSVTERPEVKSKALLVKAEWFWASVQNVACVDEKEYLFEDYIESVLSPGRKDSHATTPSSSSRRKRKRLQETLSSLVRNDSPALHKRRSSVSDAGLLSVSGSFLDCTASPDKALLDQAEGPNVETPRRNLSPRQQVFLELIQTESNYVNILHTIMTMFKRHLEDMSEPESLLNNTEMKIIFGNLPPIYETHSRMLEELRWASAHWSEDTSVGSILLKYSNDLLKAYPPFVNFFEAMKEMLLQCDLNKPRFHAFLKVCQTKPECGRQGLQDLMIRPVQRLPSISLLLNDILKHTSKTNPDYAALEKALSAIKEVMTHINEDKRKTEGQRVMFDIFNEIDNCPPDLVSSHRSFISRCEVTELSEGLSGRGNPLVLFLFSDQMEVCKKRSKAFNTLKSPNTVNGFHSSKPSVKPYKHVMMMSLNTIKRVIDIRETDECQKVFALVFKDNQELKEKLFTFTITEEDVDKTIFLRTLCRQLANNACSADADKFLAFVEPDQLDIDTSDVSRGTLSKAFKLAATRTRIKVGRAFSFNKTPSKIKRAMSTMMSPFGSSTNITPASQLAQMRLASYNNINELGNTTDSSNETPSSETLVAPMSVQPTRKLKCSSLSVTALKRL